MNLSWGIFVVFVLYRSRGDERVSRVFDSYVFDRTEARTSRGREEGWICGGREKEKTKMGGDAGQRGQDQTRVSRD